MMIWVGMLICLVSRVIVIVYCLLLLIILLVLMRVEICFVVCFVWESIFFLRLWLKKLFLVRKFFSVLICLMGVLVLVIVLVVREVSFFGMLFGFGMVMDLNVILVSCLLFGVVGMMVFIV